MKWSMDSKASSKTKQASRGVYKKSTGYFVLYALEKAVDGFVRFEDFGRFGHLYSYDRPLKKSALARVLKSLRERGLIEEDQINMGEIILKLTGQGRDALGAENWQEEIWDGKWRIVSFDIPEQKRVVRNLFRRNLKKWGFKYLHKSVWVSKRDVYEKLTKYIKELGIESWVTVIEADKISTHLL